MSLARDIAHMLLFEADDFDPEEVERVAMARSPRKTTVATEPKERFGDEYYFPVWRSGKEIGNWIVPSRYFGQFGDPNLIGMFVPTAFAESPSGMELTVAEGTREEVCRDIDNWLVEIGYVSEAEEIGKNEPRTPS